jgi:hypothetical protein
MHPSDAYAGDVLQLAKATGCGVALHPSSFTVAQDRAFNSSRDSAVDRAGDSGWHWHEYDLGALAEDAGDAVAVFFAEVVDVQPGGFHDP